MSFDLSVHLATERMPSPRDWQAAITGNAFPLKINSDFDVGMANDMQNMPGNIAEFASRLRSVPWFSNIGKPHPRDATVVRIWKWADWLGPEAGHTEGWGRYMALVHEHLERDHADRANELKATWQEIERLTMDLAILCVPEYRADRDAWYGPTTCVWHAGYIAALVACHVLVGRALADRIAEQWMWFTEGHWPCDYTEDLLDCWNTPCGPSCKLVVF